ncbi:MAG: hypothetical protein DWQ44_08250 [Bacteroidetes bacterium]|nr:MAG: hypothetical protein DWQ39_02440 [Bacteroidota bacterium]REK33627.1 MAG: hypothetical protein DWQ44_08250 [Bacteroidota bacterium]REK48613.1 MAG: hypothetical protein DWQ48_09690 [Bacteroidota bacterium]
MKRIFTLLFLLSAISLETFAQAPLQKGEKQLNAGFGFSNWGLPIYAGVDFGVHQDITVGPQISFRSYREKFRDIRYGHTIIVLGATGNYHFNTLLNIPSEWNVYAGLSLGYFIWSSPSAYIGSRGSGIGLDAQIGGRYFFSDQFGLNLEFGGGTTAGGKIGITYKF